MNAVRSSILALATVALAAGSTGCAWLLSGGDRAAMKNTVPLEITNMSNQNVCSVKIWGDTPQATAPDHNWLENTVNTPMGIEVKVIPMPPGDSRYIRVKALETYHSKVTPCGGTEQPADDIVVDKRPVRWVLQ